MVGLEGEHQASAVGDEGVVAVVREECELGTRRWFHPPHDQPHRRGVLLALERGVRRLGDVGAARQPVLDRRPVRLGNRLDQPAHARLLADRDREADAQLAAEGDDRVSIEATVGPHRQWSVRSGSADPADRLTQEVGGPPGGVGTALAQPGHEHVTAPGRNREQRVIAAHARVAVVPGTLLRQAIGLADRRVEVDGEWRCAGSRSGRPGPGEQLAGHAVELADVAPAEAAQKRAQGRWGLDGAVEDAGRPTRAQRSGVVDAVTPAADRARQRVQVPPPRARAGGSGTQGRSCSQLGAEGTWGSGGWRSRCLPYARTARAR